MTRTGLSEAIGAASRRLRVPPKRGEESSTSTSGRDAFFSGRHPATHSARTTRRATFRRVTWRLYGSGSYGARVSSPALVVVLCVLCVLCGGKAFHHKDH